MQESEVEIKGSSVVVVVVVVSDDEEGENKSVSSSKGGTRIQSSGGLIENIECSSSVDLETGEVEEEEIKVHLVKSEKDCRICHLSFDETNQESENPIELGCSCKDDLAAAHKHCAEAWFKIKGDIICEICGSIALNVASGNDVAVVTEECNGTPSTTTTATGAASAPNQPESRRFWLGHRFLNFLLACMVFAFVISWLFHFNVPS